MFDGHISFKVPLKMKISFPQLHQFLMKITDLRHIRKCLTYETVRLVCHFIVASRLEYCDSVCRSLSKSNIRKLQGVQNCLARIISIVAIFLESDMFLKIYTD